MSKSNTEINKVISKIEAAKRIADDQTGVLSGIIEKQTDIYAESIGNKISTVASDVKSSVSSIKPPKTDIFGNILKVADTFLNDSQINSDGRDKKLIRYTKESSKISIQQSREIIIEELGKLFTGSISDICSGNASMTGGTTYQMSPKEFDFMNILKVSPSSLTGRIVYESTNNDTGKIKFNNDLFSLFNSTSPYVFETPNGTSLFTATWNNSNQCYNVTTSSMELRDFFSSYYDSIEYPNIDEVVKSTMMLVLQSDDETPIDFNKGLNDLEKLITKVLSYCNLLNSGSKPLKNNPTDVFNEDEVDIEKFFDFDDNEGLDLDNEDARYRHVLKFKDCDNFEIPVNSDHIEDFVYLEQFDDDSIINTFKKTSNDVTSDSNNNMFYLSLFNSYITKIPTAIISLVLSPKMLFPVILGYKIVKNISLVDSANEIKTLLRKLNKIIYNIISRIFKIFITHFWSLIKIDLIRFLSKVAATILTNKIKRYKMIVQSLISLLTSLLTMEVNNCVDLFALIGFTIDAAFSVPAKIPLPGVLLTLSDSLPGYSADRAFMNIVETLEKRGIPTGTLYGEPNDLTATIKTIIDGQQNEMDANSYIKVSNKEIKIPTPAGVPIIIPPGILTSAGKMF